MSAQNWKQIGEKEFEKLAKNWRATSIRNLTRAAAGQILEAQMTPAERDALSTLIHQLSTEFEPGAALMILSAIDRAAKKKLHQARKRKAEAGDQPPETSDHTTPL